MRDTFIKRLSQLVEQDPQIMLVTGDLGFKVLDDYAARFPKNFLNLGVAEQNMTGVAVGLALSGKTVFTYSIGNFPTLRCLEQLRNDACYHGANVKVVVIGAGFSYGALGFSHHATEDVSILRALPGMTLVTPSDYWETGEATEALAKRPGTACLRLDKSSAGDTSHPGETFKLGRARRLCDGEALTFFTAGGILAEVLKAREMLAAEGIETQVYSMHTIKPLDETAVMQAARETGGIISVEEHVIQGGLGGAIAEVCLDNGCPPRRFRRLGLDDEFSTVVGSQFYLRERFGLDAAGIAASARELLSSG